MEREGGFEVNVRELHEEAQKLRTNAQALRSDADRMKVTVSGHEERGDTTSAAVERQRMEDMLRQADQHEQQADQHEREATEKARQVAEIERKQQEVEKNMKNQIEQLERQKVDLSGGSIGIF